MYSFYSTDGNLREYILAYAADVDINVYNDIAVEYLPEPWAKLLSKRPIFFPCNFYWFQRCLFSGGSNMLYKYIPHCHEDIEVGR